MTKVVVECALRGKNEAEQQRNLRYALWCCRYVRLLGHTVYASHTNAPWFLDDSDEKERNLGMALTEEITDNSWKHWFFNDLEALTTSQGTQGARNRIRNSLERDFRIVFLNPKLDSKSVPGVLGPLENAELRRSMWHNFERGLWPPHTEGFKIQQKPLRGNIPQVIGDRTLKGWAYRIHVADTHDSGEERVRELLSLFLQQHV